MEVIVIDVCDVLMLMLMLMFDELILGVDEMRVLLLYDNWIVFDVFFVL